MDTSVISSLWLTFPTQCCCFIFEVSNDQIHLHQCPDRLGLCYYTYSQFVVCVLSCHLVDVTCSASYCGYTWTDHKTDTDIAKELNITPVLDNIQEYKSSWLQRINKMPRNRLPSILKNYRPTGRRNQGRPLERCFRPERLTSGPTPL
jgi:hypothetical protein